MEMKRNTTAKEAVNVLERSRESVIEKHFQRNLKTVCNQYNNIDYNYANRRYQT